MKKLYLLFPIVNFLFVFPAFAQIMTRQEQLEDFDFVEKNYVEASLSFSEEGRHKALDLIGREKARAGSLSNAEFLLDIAKIMAFSQNTHDSFFWGNRLPPQTRLPFHILWFSDAMMITRTAPEQKDLLGARIEKIEGLTPVELLVKFREVCSAPQESYIRGNNNWLLESGDLLYTLGVAKSPDSLNLDLVLSDGQKVSRKISYVPAANAPYVRSPRMWSSEPTAGEKSKGWLTVKLPGEQPLYLQQGDNFFRMAPLPELNALYVQFRAHSTADALGQDINPFITSVHDEIQKSPPQNIILDLRFDVGGDIGLTRKLATFIKENVKGKIYVLIGPYTFSAGIAMVAAVKHDAGSRATLVGEKVADNLRFWSEGEIKTLPNSRVLIAARNGLWDITKGCAGEKNCYGDKFDVRVDSLDPQIKAPLTTASWLANRDPGMEAVKADLTSRSELFNIRGVYPTGLKINLNFLPDENAPYFKLSPLITFR